MESFFVRYRNYVVLFAMLAAQVVGLAVQVRRTEPGDATGVRLIRVWANAFVSPPERMFHSVKLGIVGVWDNYFYLRHAREENKQLVQTVDRLRLEQAALLEDAKEGQRLEAMLGFQEKYLYSTITAQVYGSSGTDLSKVFYIDKGSADKLQRDMAVITPGGIVGKVREVLSSHSAQVLAINDQTSGAGVILETTRIRGTLRGNALGQLQIVGLLADKRIQPGERVLTAGGDLIFPRGLPVGEVDKIISDPEQDGFIKIFVKPAAHLDRLDEVMVITSTQPRFSDQQRADIATSEELKGAEATAIEEQKKASAIMAERLPGLIDPNVPADQQPLKDTSLPNPVAHPPMPLHPDRFTPGVNDPAKQSVNSTVAPGTAANEGAKPKKPAQAFVDGEGPPPKPATPKTTTPKPTNPDAPAPSSPAPQPSTPRAPQSAPQRNP